MPDDKPRRRDVVRYVPAGEDGLTGDALRKDYQPDVLPLTPTTRLVPKVATLLSDAFTVVQEELSKMKAEQQSQRRVKVRDLQSLTELVLKLLKEVREEEKRQDPAKLDDEQMLREALKDHGVRVLVMKIVLEYEDG